VPYKSFKLENTLEYAKTYFDCATMEGVPLENEGVTTATIWNEVSAGSHWEKSFFPTEIMNSVPNNSYAVIFFV
jgi:hypothetical protein